MLRFAPAMRMRFVHQTLMALRVVFARTLFLNKPGKTKFAHCFESTRKDIIERLMVSAKNVPCCYGFRLFCFSGSKLARSQNQSQAKAMLLLGRLWFQWFLSWELHWPWLSSWNLAPKASQGPRSSLAHLVDFNKRSMWDVWKVFVWCPPLRNCQTKVLLLQWSLGNPVRDNCLYPNIGNKYECLGTKVGAFEKRNEWWRTGMNT